MKKKFARRSIKYLCCFIIMLSSYNSNSQPGSNANAHEKPYMWAPDDPQLIKNFSVKSSLMNSHTGNIQPGSFMLGNFLGMLQYFRSNYPTFECLHIYIVAYSNFGSSRYVPENYENLLTLLFAPASLETDLAYFTIPPDKSFDQDHIDDFKIDLDAYPGLPSEWRRNYLNKIMPSILKTINDKDPENYEGDYLSDTRCITYCKKDLMELVEEQTYTHRDLSNTTNIIFSKNMQASFAAFGRNGNIRRRNTGKSRLFIQLDFLKNDGKVILLEETYGFLERRAARASCTNCLTQKMVGIDNGQLCPPSSNCPTN